jgi:peptidoglycan hydrolase-like protein with peptidoglycan-binding domain
MKDIASKDLTGLTKEFLGLGLTQDMAQELLNNPAIWDKAVEALQQKYGITVDGKYGSDTKAAFEKLYDKPGTGDQPENKKGQLRASPDAGLKANYSSDELKAAEEALKDPNVSARDKEYYKNLLAAQKEKNGASSTNTTVQADANSARPGLDPKGKPDVYDKQKQLAELGAKNKDGTKLKTDGVRGTDTIKAEKEFGYLIIDPKTTISVNGTVRPVNPADIKNIPTWIKAVKEKRKTIEEVPLVYMDVVKKQLSMKESYNTNGQLMYNEDQTLARIIQLSR